MLNPNFQFWHHIAVEFRHTFNKYEVGLSEHNFEEENHLLQNGVEVWGFDGNKKKKSFCV
jgi:hypothetical protein